MRLVEALGAALGACGLLTKALAQQDHVVGHLAGQAPVHGRTLHAAQPARLAGHVCGGNGEAIIGGLGTTTEEGDDENNRITLQNVRSLDKWNT